MHNFSAGGLFFFGFDKKSLQLHALLKTKNTNALVTGQILTMKLKLPIMVSMKSCCHLKLTK